MRHRYDPELADAASALPPNDISDLATARADLQRMRAEQSTPDEAGITVTERDVPGQPGDGPVPVWIYRPEGATEALPAVLNIHGGGFVLGELASDHVDCLDIARQCRTVVVSVGYRLAPEHPYPAALHDCYAALTWLVEAADELGVDPGRVAVHGSSAGGGLSAAIALLARDRGGPELSFQFLDIPELDDRLHGTSMNEFTDTPLWYYSNAVLSWRYYLGPNRAGGTDVPAYAAPARAIDLGGLPPAYVSAMEFDPLRDEGLAYAGRLLDAGVPVELHLFPGTFHGSGLVRTAEVSQRQHRERVTVLRRALHGAAVTERDP